MVPRKVQSWEINIKKQGIIGDVVSVLSKKKYDKKIIGLEVCREKFKKKDATNLAASLKLQVIV
jgi:hypothetical protein